MNSQHRAIFPKDGPKPGAPFSPAIVSAGHIFVSGQVGVDPLTGQVVGDSVEAQARQTLLNIQTILEAAGSGLGQVVKTSAFLTRPEFFEAFNLVYREFFIEPYPARTTVICGLARPGLLVEVDVIARQPASDL